ncbi:hypothetical protein JCM8202v2_004194 [Rhodotorula sphaerocarpa]
MTSTSPRSSISDPLSPREAAATLSWSRPVVPQDAEALDSAVPFAEVFADGDDGKLTPALVHVSAVAGLGGLLFGFDTGVTSSVLLAIGSALGGKELTLGQQTGIVVSALWGALAGSLVASRAADVWGRKPVIVTAAILFALGALEQAAAQVYKEVILGRILVGVGVGLSSMTLPIYLAEIAPSKFRGRVVASLVVLITGGQVLAYVVGAAFFHVTKGWRWMFGLGAVPAIVQLLLAFSLPESPRYHLRKGRLVAAQRSLRKLYPRLSPEAIQRRLESLQADQPDSRVRPSSAPHSAGPQHILSEWREKTRSLRWASIKEGKLGLLWKDRANRRALLVAAAKIIHQTGLGQPAAFAIFVAVSNFVSTLVALRLIDRVGRRVLLLRTLLGMILGMALLAFAFLFIHVSPDSGEDGLPPGATAWAFVAVFAMCAFCISYALGLGNVAWVVQSEVFSQDLRAVGNGLATAVNWSANLIVSSTFLHLSHAATPAGAFLLYALTACFAFLFTWLYLPETKGLSLEEVRALFEAQVGGKDGAGAGDSEGAAGLEAQSGYFVVGEEEEDDEEGDSDGGGSDTPEAQDRHDAESPPSPTAAGVDRDADGGQRKQTGGPDPVAAP